MWNFNFARVCPKDHTLPSKWNAPHQPRAKEFNKSLKNGAMAHVKQPQRCREVYCMHLSDDAGNHSNKLHPRHTHTTHAHARTTTTHNVPSSNQHIRCDLSACELLLSEKLIKYRTISRTRTISHKAAGLFRFWGCRRTSGELWVNRPKISCPETRNFRA